MCFYWIFDAPHGIAWPNLPQLSPWFSANACREQEAHATGFSSVSNWEHFPLKIGIVEYWVRISLKQNGIKKLMFSYPLLSCLFSFSRSGIRLLTVRAKKIYNPWRISQRLVSVFLINIHDMLQNLPQTTLVAVELRCLVLWKSCFCWP